MAYLALYREWRPQLFQQIVGQEHVTQTLQNALTTGRVSHAYLFCGPRGTGKTTTAKILGKALNCRSRKAAEPCNHCVNCREISAGVSMDVVEIDAASHRGIDEIRDLREKIGFAPAAGEYRVYIIDEVHMLTQEAFNALLKTLEEPPAHVVFILATTEPHKVPLTILSRCQRFDFHRISIQHILDRLQEVVACLRRQAETQVEIEEGALYLIARAAEGSLRDALSILDQVTAFGGKQITVKDIHQILGTVREELLDEVTAALSSGNSGLLLELVASLVEQGKDLRLFVRELLAHLRRMLLLLISPEAGKEASPSEKERMTAQAGLLGQGQLLYLLHILSKTEQDMRWSAQPRILLEVALVQTTHATVPEPGMGLAQRLMRLEELVEHLMHITLPDDKKQVKIDAGGKINTVPTEDSKSTGLKEYPEKKKKPASGRMAQEEQAGLATAVLQPGLPQENDTGRASQVSSDGETILKQVSSRWKELLEITKKDNMPMHMYLVRSWPLQFKDRCLTIAFAREDELFKEYLDTTKNIKAVSQILSSFFNQDWQVRFACSERPQHIKFPARDQELNTGRALSLFGLKEGEEI
ncbi:MAG TPA: DNA polymerase III subunit gamma/tau [Desulfotomaculum sp.]|nr:DNA polymerase III subunit gamma/tau [Desulfotomaculum sp.]